MMSSESQGKALIFRLNDHGQGPDIVRQVFLERGWIEFEEDDHQEYEWNLWWRTSRFRTSDHDQLMPWQQLNHYPKSVAITKKDSLARNLKRMKGVHGASVFNFSPNAFNLPNDYTKFVAEFTRLRDKDPGKQQYWICKPADMSRGRGIFVFKDINELYYDCNAVVQTYISNPLLISGYKFDLRIYVVVPSFHPLNIYIFQEGLVRFSTDKFDLGCLKNVFSHLTNTSINKYGPSYTLEKECIGPGCKWTLSQLRYYFRQSNIDDSKLFVKIQYIVILTLLIQANQVPKVSNCFELYGFDIMVDENMKPWLLEVNFSPALATDCQADFFVKKPLINDLIDILNFTEEDKARGGAEYKQAKENQQQNMYPSYVPGPGGRRGLNKRGSNASLLKKKSSQTRLNASAPSQNGSVTSLVNTPRSTGTSVVETESEEALVPKPRSPDQKVVPLIPGCGLPSVQQPSSVGSRNTHPGDDSGRSSASGSDSENETDETIGRPNQHKPGDAMNSRISQDLLVVKQRQGKGNYFKSYNKILGNVPPSASIKMPVDSGFSSTSGSNSSDYAEQSAYDSKGLSSSQRQQLDFIAGHKKHRPVGHPQTLQRDLDEELPYTLDKSSNIHSRFNKQSPERTQTEPLNNRNSQLHSANPTQRKPTGIVYYKSQTELKTSPQRTASDIRYAQSLSNGRSRRQQNYDKPWRKRQPKSETIEKPGTPRRSASNPAPKIGEFYLVFPFNEATRQCAKNGLDPRTVIRETQKMLKDRLAASIEKTSAAIFTKAESSDDSGYKGSSSARSSNRSLPITLASEKTMLSSATDPGLVSASTKSSAKGRRVAPAPGVSRQPKQQFTELWSPILLETSHEHSNNL